MTNAEIKEFAARNGCDVEYLIDSNAGLIRDRRSGKAFSFSLMSRKRNKLSSQLTYQMHKLKEIET